VPQNGRITVADAFGQRVAVGRKSVGNYAVKAISH
jgi:hypothetical protein